VLSLVEITAFRLERKSCKGFFFNKLSNNESTQIITGHVIYNPAFTYKFQLKTTNVCHSNFEPLCCVIKSFIVNTLDLVMKFESWVWNYGSKMAKNIMKI
jgi:hypothetical protein